MKITKKIFYSSLKTFFSEDHANQVDSWMGSSENSKYDLIYKASIHGWKASDFHKHCDGISNVLVLIKSNGCIFGGYTPLCFDSSGNNKYDKESFLFSLSHPKRKDPIKLPHREKNVYPEIGKIYSISCSRKDGPIFGAGWDIYMSGHSFYVEGEECKYESDEMRYFLCGSYHFSTSGIEVYQIKKNEQKRNNDINKEKILENSQQKIVEKELEESIKKKLIEYKELLQRIEKAETTLKEKLKKIKEMELQNDKENNLKVEEKEKET